MYIHSLLWFFYEAAGIFAKTTQAEIKENSIKKKVGLSFDRKMGKIQNALAVEVQSWTGKAFVSR